jgi:hypothetical protein
MTQTAQIPWIPPQVRVTERGRDLIVENPIPLASYPHNIGVWLRRNAERFPDQPFILQRNAEGEWHGPTYAETLARILTREQPGRERRDRRGADGRDG